MQLCLVHNEYGKFSGEEAVVAQQTDLLKKHGHIVDTFTRTSASIGNSLASKATAFFSGIYSPSSRKTFAQFIRYKRPDLVHIHNLFPLISPSILPECRIAGLPVVMTLHNFRLICPNALLFRNGRICRECLGGGEWNCIRHNCENSLGRSVGYALRTCLARKRRWFLDNVDVFICLTEFQRQIHISEGFPADRCIVIPNFIDTKQVIAETRQSQSSDTNTSPLRSQRFCGEASDASTAESQSTQISETHADTLRPQRLCGDPYLLYVGRISHEKDVPTLLTAATLLPDIPFKIAGSYWRMADLPRQAPANVSFLGELQPDKLSDLYTGAKVLIFPTRWYEGFPVVLLEAMAHGKPIVCTDIGGLGEIVEDRITGLLYETGNARQLADRISELLQNPALSRLLGQAGQRKVETLYNPEKGYDSLMAAYRLAQQVAAARKAV